MSTATLITAEEFAVLSFDGPVELVRGEIVEMPCRGVEHGKIALNVAVVLELWARLGDEFDVVANDSGLVTERGPDTVRGPDVSVIRRSRLVDDRLPKGYFAVSPDLVIEVRSPSDRWTDIIAKVGEYLTCGVLEVWVVDPDSRRVHIYRPNDEPDVLNLSDTIQAAAVLPGFSANVSDFFRRIG